MIRLPNETTILRVRQQLEEHDLATNRVRGGDAGPRLGVPKAHDFALAKPLQLHQAKDIPT